MFSTAIANHVPYAQAMIAGVEARGTRQVPRLRRDAGSGNPRDDGTHERLCRRGLRLVLLWQMASAVMRLSAPSARWAARRQGLGDIRPHVLHWLAFRTVEHIQDLSVEDHGVEAKRAVMGTNWQVWRRATPEDWGGHPRNVLTPSSIRSIPDEQLKDLVKSAGTEARGDDAKLFTCARRGGHGRDGHRSPPARNRQSRHAARLLWREDLVFEMNLFRRLCLLDDGRSSTGGEN